MRQRCTWSRARIMCGLLLFIFGSSATACGVGDEVVASREMGHTSKHPHDMNTRGKADHHNADHPDLGEDLVANVPEMAFPPDLKPSRDIGVLPPEDMRIESVRFRLAYKTCNTPECSVDVRFGLLNGTMLVFHYGVMIDKIALESQEYDALRQMVWADEFVQMMGGVAAECAAPSGELLYNVSFYVRYRDTHHERQNASMDVSLCYGNEVDEWVDPLIDFSERMARKYDD